MRRRFSTAAIMVLTIGLIVDALIILFSFSAFSLFYPAVAVKSVEQAKERAGRYVARFGSDLRIKEIMEFPNHFYVMIQEKSTEINALAASGQNNWKNIP